MSRTARESEHLQSRPKIFSVLMISLEQISWTATLCFALQRMIIAQPCNYSSLSNLRTQARLMSSRCRAAIPSKVSSRLPRPGSVCLWTPITPSLCTMAEKLAVRSPYEPVVFAPPTRSLSRRKNYWAAAKNRCLTSKMKNLFIAQAR